MSRNLTKDFCTIPFRLSTLTNTKIQARSVAINSLNSKALSHIGDTSADDVGKDAFHAREARLFIHLVFKSKPAVPQRGERGWQVGRKKNIYRPYRSVHNTKHLINFLNPNPTKLKFFRVCRL